MSLVGGTHDSKSSAIEKALVAGGISSITVGIIGGGVIGGVVAHALLDAGIPPPAVLMSTRSPLRQKDLAARGVAVVFDNALVAARCQLLILCVLPAQLQDVAKTLRPQSHTVVLSLVGATPIAKIRSLFHSPHALSAGADDTLPLLIEAQRALRQDAIDGDEPIEQYGLSAGRLPDEQVLELSAAGFASDAQAVARAVNALRIVCGDVCVMRRVSRSPPPSVPRPHTRATSRPIMYSITDGSTMGLFECIFVFDFINTLGVVHVPHLRKPTGGDGTGRAGGRAGERPSPLVPRRRAHGGRPARAPVLDGPLTLTHVTSEKSRRPVP